MLLARSPANRPLTKLTKRFYMPTVKTQATSSDFPYGFVDLRSDSVTRSCEKMRQAMATADVGDDIYGDCPTTNKLQEEIAKQFGKEAALLTSSGTMANCISMMVLGQKKGDSVIMGNLSHIVNYERAGVSAVAGIMPWIVANEPDATLNMPDIELACGIAPFELIPNFTGISLESSHNLCKGKVLRPEYIRKVKKLAEGRGAKLHLDGARAWNASLFLGVEMKEFVKDFDILNVCLSKGLGCPIGSLVVGSAEDIKAARAYRKMLGGAMRQTGHFAACGLLALEDWQDKLTQDNANARWLAEELAGIPGVVTDPSEVETNILQFRFEPEVMERLGLNYHQFVARMRQEELVAANSSFTNDYIRLVTHRDVSRAMCEHTISGIKRILNSAS